MKLKSTIPLLAMSMVFASVSAADMVHGSKKGQNKAIKQIPKKKRPITPAAYRIYDGNGKSVAISRMFDKLQSAQVVFLGETHDDPIAHRLQARILEHLHRCHAKEKTRVALSLEMFERDVQHVVDEYLADLISESHFLASSRPWKNYKDDYRTLVEYAKRHGLAVIAANAPRRYVNRVGRLGADSLKEIANPSQRGLPPLPFGEASSQYAAKFKAIMKKMHKKAKKAKKTTKDEKPIKKKSLPKPKFDINKALQAQSLWDAAMAYSIAEHLLQSPQTHIVHLNGSFHTDSRLGIPEHLLRYRPATSLMVVTILSEKSFPNFDAKEMMGRGDFVIVTDPSFRKKPKSK